MSSAEIIALCALAINLVGGVIGLTWGVSSLKDAIRKEMQQHLDKMDSDVTALREKITEVELWTRDTFMRRESFYKAMETQGQDMRIGFQKMETRLERMETKIDSRNT